MTAYAEVIVGTDGTRTATEAVRAAIGVAAALGVPLVVATAWYRDLPDEPVPSEKAGQPGTPSGHEAHWATETTSDAAALAREAGIGDVRQAQPTGAPADALVRLGQEHPDALIVVGTRGIDERAERLLGNVPHQLTHHAHNDLLLVRSRGDRDADPRWSSVALATDGSPTAAAACVHGLALAEAFGVAPVLVTVAADPERGEGALARTADASPALAGLDGVVLTGSLTDTLVAGAADYDLLVLGNKGMSGPSRLLGSVANRVTHHVPTDLLLVNTSR